MRLLKIKFLLCLLVFSISTNAQQLVGNYIVRRYDDLDGLPSGDCFKLLIDQRGNIWITTSVSISRFDGHNFTNYTNNNGLAGQAVFDIQTDDAGNIYCYTEGGIQRFTENESHPFSPPLCIVPDTLSEDILPIHKGLFWITGGARPGLFLATDKKVTRYPHIDDHIYYIEKDNKGYVYAISREQRIWVLKNNKIQGVVEMPKNEQGSFWAATSPDGEFWYTDSKAIYQIAGLHIVHKITLPNPQKDACIGIGKRSGSIFYGTDTLYQYHNQHWSQMQLPTKLGYIYDMKEDNNGTLWLATSSGLYSILLNPAIAMPGQRTLHFLKRDNIVLLNSKLLPKPPSKQIAGYSYAYTSTNGMNWYCTPDNGLHYTLPGSEKLNRYVAPDTSRSMNNDKLFLKANEDHLGRVWFSSYNGIDCYTSGHFVHYGTSQGLSIRAVYDLAVDGRGRVFAGNNGLFVYNNGRFNLILKPQLGRSTVYSLATDVKGNLWAMNKGGKLYKIAADKLTTVPSDSLELSVNNKTISTIGLGFDLYNNLWIAAKRYFIIFRPDASGKYSNANKLLLPALIEENGKLTCGEDGNMYFYNRRGILLRINANSILQTALTAPLVSPPYFTTINTIRKNGNKDPLLQFENDTTPKSATSFDYGNNNIEFRFAATSAVFPGEVKYRYMLKGIDRTWQPPKTIGRATYISIPPGEYTFLVQAADARNNWSPSLSFSFTVLRPWYRTWWGYTLETVAVLLAASAMFSLGLRVNKNRNAIQRLFIEQQLKTIRAQINPHFLHNIFAFLAKRIQEDSVIAADSLTTLSKYIREVLYATDKAVVSLEDEILFTEKYIEIQQMLLNNVFTYQLSVEKEVDTLGLKVPSMLLQPIVENACKYGIDRKTNHNMICLTITKETNYVSCAISDTGNSTHLPATQEGYVSKGLTLTKERLLLLYKGHKTEPFISTSANLKGGTTVIIHLPLR